MGKDDYAFYRRWNKLRPSSNIDAHPDQLHTDKKRKKIPHILGNSEGSGAKACMTYGLPIYGDKCL